MPEDPEHLARLILKVRSARLKLAAQIDRAIENYHTMTELESTLVERSERVQEELVRTEAKLRQVVRRTRVH